MRKNFHDASLLQRLRSAPRIETETGESPFPLRTFPPLPLAILYSYDWPASGIETRITTALLLLCDVHCAALEFIYIAFRTEAFCCLDHPAHILLHTLPSVMFCFATVSPVVAVYIGRLGMYLARFGASKLYSPRQDCLGKIWEQKPSRRCSCLNVHVDAIASSFTGTSIRPNRGLLHTEAHTCSSTVQSVLLA